MNRRGVLLSFSVFLAIGIVCFHVLTDPSKSSVGYMISDGEEVSLYFDEYYMPIRGIDIEGGTFFFLPSFICMKLIDYSDSGIRLYNENGELIERPLMNSTQTVLVEVSGEGKVPYRVGFYQSANLYTLDVKLDGYQADAISKEEYTKADMRIFSPDGKIMYESGNVGIKGRGNSTWDSEKKPYEIKLPEKASIAGLRRSDNWTLLANAKDPTKMKNQIAYDLSRIFGLEYTTESEWVDLYINGEYMGNYQACHEPEIGQDSLDIRNLEVLNKKKLKNACRYENEYGKGYMYDGEIPYDISGGYLIEYTQNDLYDEKESGFIIEKDKCFVIKSPNNAARDEVEFIQSITQNTDRILHENAGYGQYKVINRDSFAKRFLVDEITLNNDAAFCSHFFYKKSGDDMLYAGPCWDYDKTCGYGAGDLHDYTNTILNHRSNILDWNTKLMETEDFQDYVWRVIAQESRQIDQLINKGIDDYYSEIESSIEMDHIRWKGRDAMQYDSVYDNVRYLKFFLYNRMQWLVEGKKIDASFNMPDVYEKTYHQLIYNMPDGSRETKTVEDGAQIETDAGWYYSDFPETPTFFVPVFQDMEVKYEGMGE